VNAAGESGTKICNREAPGSSFRHDINKFSFHQINGKEYVSGKSFR